MKTRVLILVLSLALIPAFVPRASRADVPPGATWSQVWFPSADGTLLRADVLLPANREPGQRHPVILSIGPYFGRNSMNGGSRGPVERFSDLWTEGRIFERGYAYVQVDSRGYGGSDGCNDFGGPGERMDAEAAVNWAGDQPWSNGNVGMWGKSYDAWTQVMALAENPIHLKAAVVQSPIIDGYRIAFMNGVHYEAGWYATPSLYAGYDLDPSTASDRAPEEVLYPAKGTLTNPHCYAQNLAFTPNPDRSFPYWQAREISSLAARSSVPVIWSHGFNDVNTKPDNFLPVFSGLRGPKRAWIGQWDHVRGNQSDLVGRNGFMDEAMAWFDRYLKGLDAPDFGAIEVQNGQGEWRSETAWPPKDARHYPLKLLSGTYFDGPRPNAAVLPGPSWTFTQPAPYAMHLAGTVRVRAFVSPLAPGANLIAQLYDLDRKGKARIITRGAYRLSGPEGATFELYPQDWILRKGHRFAMALTATDSMFTPTPTLTQVQVLGGHLRVPFLKYARGMNLKGGPAAAMRGVREVAIADPLLDSRTIRATFPPRLKRR